MIAADLEARPRVVLVGGPGGAGSSRAVVALAASLSRSGRRVAIADLDPWHGATAQSSIAGVELLGPERDRLADPVGRLLDRVGLDGRLAAEAARLPGAEVAEMVHRLGTTALRDDLDVVLVDLGSQVLDVVELADRLPWMASHLLRAQRGWLSSTRPRAAQRIPWWPGADAHAEVQRLVERTSEWAQVVRTAGLVLVADSADRRLRRLRLGLRLHEFPEVEPVNAQTVATWQDLPCPERPGAASLVADGDTWTWRLGFPGLRSADLRVGRSDDDLALEVLGVRRLVTLPSALRRFPATTARLASGQLEIIFGLKESRT